MVHPHLLRDDLNDILAAALGDHPETVIETHLLRRRLCHAYVLGDPRHFRAAIVQGVQLIEEPAGYGDDVDALFELLHDVEAWTCVCVAGHLASKLGRLIEDRYSTNVRYLDDIYHIATECVRPVPHPGVRALTAADLPLLLQAPRELRGSGYADTATMLSTGVAAGVIVSGALVSLAQVTALSERYADVGVFTDPNHRGRGYASASAALVCQLALAIKRIPVWSCGENNEPSLRIARHLGFREVSRRRYVILEDTRAKPGSAGH